MERSLVRHGIITATDPHRVQLLNIHRPTTEVVMKHVGPIRKYPVSIVLKPIERGGRTIAVQDRGFSSIVLDKTIRNRAHHVDWRQTPTSWIGHRNQNSSLGVACGHTVVEEIASTDVQFASEHRDGAA